MRVEMVGENAMAVVKIIQGRGNINGQIMKGTSKVIIVTSVVRNSETGDEQEDMEERSMENEPRSEFTSKEVKKLNIDTNWRNMEEPT